MKTSFNITHLVKIPNDQLFSPAEEQSYIQGQVSKFSFCIVSMPVVIQPYSDPADPTVSTFSPTTSPVSSLAGTSSILYIYSGESLTDYIVSGF